MISAGRVLLMPKGAYDASTTYELLDIVSYNGSSYIAKGTTTGNLPTNTTYWQLSAYGGNAANVASNFAELETTSIAVAVHNVDDLFIDENSQLMITTQKINIGDAIVSGTNCTPTSVETLINNVATYFANLDATDRKLKAIAEIEVQTDLHTLTIGEYFKSDTSFYVTNAPTGIDSEITAVFRLTVEAAYDDESALNAPMLLTLRTLNGKVYKQAYDGVNWSSWAQEATEAEISTLQYDDIQIQQLVANFQGTLTANKNYSAGDHFVYQYNEYELDSSVSSGSALVIGTNCHATGDVSSQISSVNEALTDEVTTRATLGAHNLLENVATTTVYTDGNKTITFTVNSDGSVTVNGETGSTTNRGLNLNTSVKTVSGQRYILSGCPSDGNDNTFYVDAFTPDFSINVKDTGNGIEFIGNGQTLTVRVLVKLNTEVSNKIFHPMLRLATDSDPTYQPYAMTNRELTERYIIQKETKSNISVTANTYTDIYVQFPVSNYTIVGVLGTSIGSGGVDVSLVTAYPISNSSGEYVFLRVINTAASAKTIGVDVLGLFEKK